jgi:hypothetical protein
MAKKKFGSVMEMMDFFKQTGSQGGKRAAERMTKAARTERAKKAAEARWAKKTKSAETPRKKAKSKKAK